MNAGEFSRSELDQIVLFIDDLVEWFQELHGLMFKLLFGDLQQMLVLLSSILLLLCFLFFLLFFLAFFLSQLSLLCLLGLEF